MITGISGLQLGLGGYVRQSEVLSCKVHMLEYHVREILIQLGGISHWATETEYFLYL